MFAKPTSAKTSIRVLFSTLDVGLRRRGLPDFALILIGTLCIAGCGPSAHELPPASANTVRIVSSLPQRGKLSTQSRQINEAVDLAITQRGGAAGGLHVEHIALDDGADETGDWAPDREEANANEAAADNGVVAYIGPYNSGAASLSLPITNRAGLLQLGPAATWPGLTLEGWNPGEPQSYYPSGKRNFVRLMPPDSLQGNAAASWAAQSRVGSVYLLQDGSSYSGGLARAFTAQAKSVGLAISGETLVVEGQTGYVDKVVASGADAVFYAASSAANAAAAAKALQGTSLPGGVYASDTAMSDQFLAEAPTSGPEWHIVHNGVPAPLQSAAWNSFSSAFQQAYKETPGQFAANAFDLSNLLLGAITRSGANRGEIMRDVMSTKGYSGVMGEISFDANGDIEQWQMSGYIVLDGRFVFSRMLGSGNGQ